MIVKECYSNAEVFIWWVVGLILGLIFRRFVK